jgi:hypothetical protein
MAVTATATYPRHPEGTCQVRAALIVLSRRTVLRPLCTGHPRTPRDGLRRQGPSVRRAGDSVNPASPRC